MKVHNKKTKDYVFTPETSPEIVPAGKRIFVKGNKHGQIEDMNPREINGVNLFTKYYHRDQRVYVDQYVAEVARLWRKEEKDA
jgi:hypothetical protein